MNYEITDIEVNDFYATAILDYFDEEGNQLAVEYYRDYDEARWIWLLFDEDGDFYDTADAEDISEDVEPYADILREEFDD